VLLITKGELEDLGWARRIYLTIAILSLAVVVVPLRWVLQRVKLTRADTAVADTMNNVTRSIYNCLV